MLPSCGQIWYTTKSEHMRHLMNHVKKHGIWKRGPFYIKYPYLGIKNILKVEHLRNPCPVHILHSHIWSEIYLEYSGNPDFFTAFLFSMHVQSPVYETILNETLKAHVGSLHGPVCSRSAPCLCRALKVLNSKGIVCGLALDV